MRTHPIDRGSSIGALVEDSPRRKSVERITRSFIALPRSVGSVLSMRGARGGRLSCAAGTRRAASLRPARSPTKRSSLNPYGSSDTIRRTRSRNRPRATRLPVQSPRTLLPIFERFRARSTEMTILFNFRIESGSPLSQLCRLVKAVHTVFSQRFDISGTLM